MNDVVFRLDVIEAGAEWLLNCTSSHGSAKVRVPPLNDADGIASSLQDIENAVLRSATHVITRRGPTNQVAQEFGERLAAVVLDGDVGIVLDRCRIKARELGTGLRVVVNPDGPSVARVPWEFLADPRAADEYLALRAAVVRSPTPLNPVTPLRTKPPLRVLGVNAQPVDVPALDADRERQRIAAAFDRVTSDQVEIRWLPGDRWADLAAALRGEPWHVLHFIGHGGFNDDGGYGYIQLSDDAGKAVEVRAVDLARLVADNHHLRLVVLNACESAMSGRAAGATSTAAKLIGEGVPAVVAMQYEISDGAALDFACSFYSGIAAGVPVDRAMTKAREDVKMSQRSLEWATPVLYLSSADATVFEVEGTERSVADPVRERPPPTSSAPRPSEARLSRLVASPAVGHVGPATHAAVGPGDLLAVAGRDGVLRVVCGADAAPVASCCLPRRDPAIRVAWGPWRRYLASGHVGGTVVVWDLPTEVPVRVVATNAGRVTGVAFSGDGRWLAVGADDGTVRVLDTAGNAVRAFRLAALPGAGGEWRAPVRAVVDLAFAPGDRQLVVAGDDGLVRLVNVRGETTGGWDHPQPVTSLAVCADKLVTGCQDGRLRLWAWAGELMRRVDAIGPAATVAASPDGRTVAAASTDGVVHLCTGEGRAWAANRCAGRPVGTGFLAAAARLITVTEDGDVEGWDLDRIERTGT